MTPLVRWLDLGLIGYRKAYAIQEKIHQGCCRDEFGDTLLFQENYPVITLGKSSSEDNLLLSRDLLAQKGIEVLNVDRGGDITYHGPGQIVISPVLHLKKYVPGVHQYVRSLEQIVINILENYNIHGHRIEGASGVWVGEEKIAAVGIAIRHGITMHGIAINVQPDLSHFQYIVPCGIKDRGITSLKKSGIRYTDLSEIREGFIVEFNKIFNTQTTKMQIDEMRYLKDEL